MDAMAGLSRGALVLDWTRCRGPMYCLHWMSGCTMRCDAPGLARETRTSAIVPAVDSNAAEQNLHGTMHVPSLTTPMSRSSWLPRAPNVRD